MPERIPYESPYFAVTFYPEDTSFTALVKTIRASCRTIELFEIARTVVAKAERFTVLINRRDAQEPEPRKPAPAPAPAGSEPAAGEAASVRAPAPTRAPLWISIPDGLPFESEEAALAHVLQRHIGLFFDLSEAEVEPPKGNYLVISRCGMTGTLLGPPNYHRYAQIVQQHYAAAGLRMPFEAFKARIESVRDPEVVKQWQEKMRKVTRYTWKGPAEAAPALEKPAAPPQAPAPAPEAPAPAPEAAAPAADAPVPAAESQAPVAEAAPPQEKAAEQPQRLFFDSFEDAKTYLMVQARDRLVRTASHARFHGREVESLPSGEVRRAVEGALERQRRFPLDTANALRGRLRREHFTIFKKGSKGISYVCAVKPKFRIPGQTFAESIGALTAFIEGHPMVKAGDLVKGFLGIEPAAPPPPEGEAAAAEPKEAAAPTGVLSIEQREKIARMQSDLLWLVREGYVTELIDGRLYAPPPMVEARKREVEREEHDPENFPGADTAAETPPAEGQEPEGEVGFAEAAPPPEPALEAPVPEAPAAPEIAPEPPSAEVAPQPEPSPEPAPKPDEPAPQA